MFWWIALAVVALMVVVRSVVRRRNGVESRGLDRAAFTQAKRENQAKGFFNGR